MKTVRQVLARMISTKYLHTSTNLQESNPHGYQLHTRSPVSMIPYHSWGFLTFVNTSSTTVVSDSSHHDHVNVAISDVAISDVNQQAIMHTAGIVLVCMLNKCILFYTVA